MTSYIAFLCYPHKQGDGLEIKFEKPDEEQYSRVLAISFSVLHQWTNKDKELYK